MAFRSNIERPKHGWMRIQFTKNQNEIEFLASYVPYDSFYELITTLQSVYQFGNSHDIRINEEPTESILNFEKNDERLVITSNPIQSTPTLRIETNFEDGCREIALNICRLYQQISFEEFHKNWPHNPPKERIAELISQFNLWELTKPNASTMQQFP